MERLSMKDVWKVIVSTGEWNKMKRNEFVIQTPFIFLSLYRSSTLLRVEGSVIIEGRGIWPFEFISLLRNEIYDTSNWTLIQSELSLEELEREFAIAIRNSGIEIEKIKAPRNFYLTNIELRSHNQVGWGWSTHQNIVMANSAQEAVAMLSFYHFWHNEIEVIPFLLPTGLWSESQ